MATFCGSCATISLLSIFHDGNTNETKQIARYMKTSATLKITKLMKEQHMALCKILTLIYLLCELKLKQV